MRVVKIVEQDVAHKVDTSYIQQQLNHVDKVGITYICTNDDRNEDDWTDENGVRQIIIKLSYDEVKQSQDARPLMLKKAQERLGMAA